MIIFLTSKFINCWLKVFCEIVVWLIGIFVLVTLIWWLLMFLSQGIGNCQFSDSGFLKPAYIECDDTLISNKVLKPILQAYESVLGIPLFVLFLFVIHKLSVILTIVGTVSIFVSLILIHKDSDGQFPMLARHIITTIKGSRE